MSKTDPKITTEFHTKYNENLEANNADYYRRMADLHQEFNTQDNDLNRLLITAAKEGVGLAVGAAVGATATFGTMGNLVAGGMAGKAASEAANYLLTAPDRLGEKLEKNYQNRHKISDSILYLNTTIAGTQPKKLGMPTL